MRRGMRGWRQSCESISQLEDKRFKMEEREEHLGKGPGHSDIT
jgi:hypothetical protein